MGRELISKNGNDKEAVEKLFNPENWGEQLSAKLSGLEKD